MLKGVFIDIRLKELFQMFSIHLPDQTSVSGPTEKRPEFTKSCLFKKVFSMAPPILTSCQVSEAGR